MSIVFLGDITKECIEQADLVAKGLGLHSFPVVGVESGLLVWLSGDALQQEESLDSLRACCEKCSCEAQEVRYVADNWDRPQSLEERYVSEVPSFFSAQHYLEAAESYVRCAQWDSAKQALLQALSKDRLNMQAYCQFHAIAKAEQHFDECLHTMRSNLPHMKDEPEFLSIYSDLLRDADCYEECIHMARRTLMFSPRDTRALLALGYSLNKMGSVEESLSCYKLAWEYSGESSLAALVGILSQLWYQEDYLAMVQYCDGLSSSFSSPQLSAYKGLALFKLENFSLAEGLLLEGLQSQGELFLPCRMALANCFHRLHKHDLILSLLEGEEETWSLEEAIFATSALLAKGEIEKARSYLRSFPSSWQESVGGQQLFFHLALELKDWERARRVLTGMARVLPQAKLYRLKGLLWECQGEQEEALSCLESAYKLAPNRSDYCLCLAWAKLNIGQAQEASELFTKLISSLYHSVSASDLIGLACAHRACERLDMALLVLEQAQALAPCDVDVWELSGELLLYKGQWKEAKSSLEHTIKLDPERYSAVLLLMECCLLLGDSARFDELMLRLDPREMVSPLSRWYYDIESRQYSQPQTYRSRFSGKDWSLLKSRKASRFDENSAGAS